MREKEGHGANEGTDRKKEREGRTEGAELGTQQSCRGLTLIPCTELPAFNF